MRENGKHVTDRVGKSDAGKLLWDFTIQTDHVIEHRRPDIVFLDKQQGLCHIIDVEVAGDARMEEKEWEKLEKMPGFKKESFSVMGGNCSCNASSGWVW